MFAVSPGIVAVVFIVQGQEPDLEGTWAEYGSHQQPPPEQQVTPTETVRVHFKSYH